MKKILLLMVVLMSFVSCVEESKKEEKTNEIDKTSEISEDSTLKVDEITEISESSKEEVIVVKNNWAAGKAIYQDKCASCHMENGEKVGNTIPPLAGADFLKDKQNTIKQLIVNPGKKIIVNGVKYRGMMTDYNLSHQETADVVNYVLNSWGNKFGTVTVKDVAEIASQK